MKNSTRVRLSLELSPALNTMLERMADETVSTKADVIRKALVLLEVAIDARRRGKKFGIAAGDQILETEVVGL